MYRKWGGGAMRTAVDARARRERARTLGGHRCQLGTNTVLPAPVLPESLVPESTESAETPVQPCSPSAPTSVKSETTESQDEETVCPRPFTIDR